MPCKRYKSIKQRKLCYATKEWKDWSGIKKLGGSKMARKRKRLKVGQSKVTMRKIRGKKRRVKVTRKSRGRYKVVLLTKKRSKKRSMKRRRRRR